MKSLLNLLSALLDDLGSICSVETARDFETLKSRAQHEGISFFTITLPEFSSDFERALENSRIDSTLFVGWRKRGCLPAFLQGFTSLVFGASGEVRKDADETAVYAVRQICRIFKKVRLDCSSSRIERTFEKYETLEASLPDELPLEDDRREHFGRTCDIILQEVIGSREFNSLDLVPRHGPGATAEGVSGNAKYSHGIWHERLEEVFPFDGFLFTSVSQVFDSEHGLNHVQIVDQASERPVRVIGVPKTLKGPRIIAIEPVCMQYTQQAVSRWLMDKIESSPLTRHSIRFTDQTVNQSIARSSSYDRKFATLDLSDASDRVLFSSVQLMLRSQPALLDAVSRTRSMKAELPNGNIISLKKFASMGSALCFPIESLYFYCVMVHSILWAQSTPPQARDIRRISRVLHVYGDDLIMPVDQTDPVIEGLTTFGCKVNVTKSFRSGSFRESCGCDAFKGIDVTPVYVREASPRSRRDSVGLLSWVSTSNQLYWAGCWKAANYMKDVVERLLGKLPVVGNESPGLGWQTLMGLPPGLRLCNKLHTPLVRTYKVRQVKEKDTLQGYPALLKYFLNCSESRPFFPRSLTSKEHLLFSVRRGAVSRKRHWVPAL